MDSKRFDSITKSLAAWTSRRRFLGGITGAAAGSVLVRHSAEAQVPIDTNICSLSEFPDTAARVQSKSHDLLMDIAHVTVPTNSKPHGPRFDKFLQNVRCLLAEGSTASDSKWNDEQVRLFVNSAVGFFDAFSVGFTGAEYKFEPLDARPASIDALVLTAPQEVCGQPSCTADTINDTFTCLIGCNGQDGCPFDCFLQFIREYLLGLPADPATNRPARNACMPTLAVQCGDDCCLGSCACGTGC